MAAELSLTELVEKLPPTDRELEAAKATEKAAQEGATPPPPAKAPVPSKFTGPDPAQADALCEQVLAGGRARLMELIELVRDPADPSFNNYKPEYLLHCLSTYVARPGKETQRRLLIDALVAGLTEGNRPTAVRAMLLRELQWIGDDRAVAAVGKFLTDESLCAEAAAALLAIKPEGAAREFRRALPQATGRCRLVVVQSLAQAADPQAASILTEALSDSDREVRLAAAWGLARLGQASAVEALLKAADVEPSYERIKATQACLLLAERLAGNGNRQAATRIYRHLRDTRTDPTEQYVRQVAEKALASLQTAN
jgi:HEAT repeat protein